MLRRPFPTPPAALRRGPFRRGAFTSALRSPRLTSHLGLLLAVAFGVCFLTGLLSHAIQHPPDWFWWPARPVWLYRVTQGLHVATGLASVPLLGAKLWSVYPKLFAWPPFRDLAHALERCSVLLLASTAIFQLVTGILNIARWYAPMPFGFVAAHHWTAWLAVGALLVHVAVKLPIVRRALSRTPRAVPTDGLSRRDLLAAVGATAAVVTVATVGQTVRPLRDLSVLAPRRPDTGPQGLPVNTSAAAARITVPADFRVTVTGPAGRHAFTVADLAALPQHTVSLPITCVEGWSADARWTGVRVRDLMAMVGFVDGSVLVESLQQDSPYRSSVLAPPHAHDDLTLLALRLNGEILHPDHGYPCRLIAPNRPGVLQTKWVTALTVVPS
ncbi:molybdopterin-binding protein [Longispora fulva]|uniref:Oxidoreductase molybdopterin-binding domain-containing protein n=1 Tax=Longispora fulva TaxID=619741 RepID=A0A8J7KEC0_9ACTN|nr:molybdopterin-dependent oxidoreductase [Longispora fulva]MBG6134940.1 hypothetical protein [Longispora fulva]GIG56828.1 molybdopterin-binding protein [Longispora fulva]